MAVRNKDTREHDTIISQVQFHADTAPNRPAFIFRSPGGRFVLSRRDVLDLSSRFAYRLTQHGVKTGDVVCIALPNCPERVVVEFGVQLAGAISMNGQVLRADGEDIMDALRKAKVKTMVTNPDQNVGAWKIIERYFVKTSEDVTMFNVSSKSVPTLDTIEVCKFRSEENGFLDSLSTGPTYISQKCKLDDVVTIFTTSGSTGYSKLVKHTSKTMLDSGCSLSNGLQIGEDECYFSIAPLGWIGGYPLQYLFTGSTRVLLDDTVAITDKTKLAWDAICLEDVSVACMTAFHLMSIYDRPELWKGRGKILKRILSGGQPFKKDYLCVLGKLTQEVVNAYGSTEVGVTNFLTINAKTASQFQDYNAGYSLEGFVVKIVDDDLQSLPPKTLGEIIVLSPTLCLGYVDNPEANSSFLPDGWFRTDDMGFLTEDGQLSVEGRRSDAIMHGGYILYPFWLEENVSKCPGVRQVVIVPVPDKVLHHEICACVKPENNYPLSSEEFLKFCKQEIALEKTSMMTVTPKYVVFMDQFPTTVTGKLDRKGLATLAASTLGI